MTPFFSSSLYFGMTELSSKTMEGKTLIFFSLLFRYTLSVCNVPFSSEGVYIPWAEFFFFFFSVEEALPSFTRRKVRFFFFFFFSVVCFLYYRKRRSGSLKKKKTIAASFVSNKKKHCPELFNTVEHFFFFFFWHSKRNKNKNLHKHKKIDFFFFFFFFFFVLSRKRLFFRLVANYLDKKGKKKKNSFIFVCGFLVLF